MNGPRESPFRSVRVRDRPRLRNARRTTVLLVVLVVGTLLVGSTATWVLAAQRIDGTSVVALDREPEDATNVLVALAPAADGPVDGVFLLQLSERRRDPAVLVLPVGLEVDVADRGVLTLGVASDRGGMALLVEEVAEYTDLPLHHYVRVDRTALAAAVDGNGGIEDCPTEDAPACPNVLGADLLDRLAAPVDAVSGQDRVRALADAARLVGGEVGRLRTLVDPRRSLHWAGAWRDVLRTDVDPGPGGMRDLARLLAGFDPERLQVRVLPGLIDDGRVTITPEQATTLLAAFAQVEPLPADVGTEAPRELVPEDVVVQVLNGVGRAGVAGEMSDFLTERGFQVSDVDNAPRFDDRAPTTVGYVAEEDLPLAELVQSFLPGAEIRQLINDPPEGTDIVVTVGANGTG